MIKSYTARLSEVEEQITFLDAQDALNTGIIHKLLRKKKNFR